MRKPDAVAKTRRRQALKPKAEGRKPVRIPPVLARIATVIALVLPASVIGGHLTAQAPAYPKSPATNSSTWTVPKTPDGHPDFQGVWDYRTVTPLERPPQFAGKEFLTDQEVADYERRAAARTDGRPPDDPRSDPSVQPPEWLDYGKKMVGSNRSSLIVDPPDGRIPPLTGEAQAKAATRRAEARNRGAADDPEIRMTWERCITRGLPEGVLPAGYNNNIQIFQSPGYVVIVDGNDSRRAHHPARRPAASPEWQRPVDGRLARSLGRQHARRRHHQFFREGQLPRIR